MPTITGVQFIGLSVRDIRRSTVWYTALLEMEVVSEERSEDDSSGKSLLKEPRSGLMIGLYAHASNPGDEFSEFRAGLDHLEFGVSTREELADWVARLDTLRIPHSGLRDQSLGALVTFRDPDNIQLEFYWERPPSAPGAPNSPAR